MPPHIIPTSLPLPTVIAPRPVPPEPTIPKPAKSPSQTGAIFFHIELFRTRVNEALRDGKNGKMKIGSQKAMLEEAGLNYEAVKTNFIKWLKSQKLLPSNY